MTFSIITHTHHYKVGKDIFAYSPYIREMNLWLKQVDTVSIVAPKTSSKPSLFSDYIHKNITFTEVPSIKSTSIPDALKTIFALPLIALRVYKVMKLSDHIHLRCPGNIGLIGCLVQILFPKTPKTVKYAGNWDPKAKQPWSYNLQKWILKNRFLTKNCTVLVYGKWPKQTKNIKSFFTATYSETKKKPVLNRDYSKSIRCLFVGTLSEGKRPLKAIQLVEALINSERKARLDIYGDGRERDILQDYILKHDLSEYVNLQGNKSTDSIKKAYQEAHFLILPSQSEGWPKAVAEAMFWGCIPITTPVSCIPWMLDYGKRGFLLDENFSWKIVLQNKEKLQTMAVEASNWSRNYTLEIFEKEIDNLLTLN